MSDRLFFDTNILVYSYSLTEPNKQLIARNLISKKESFISTQVLQELTNVIIKKFHFSYESATNAVEECCLNSTLTINSKSTIISAHHIAGKYKFSFYDSLIISAALECNCSILYSEDMKDGLLIEKQLKIINLFKT